MPYVTNRIVHDADSHLMEMADCLDDFLDPKFRARYDDLLTLTSTLDFQGRARLRFDVEITQGEANRPVVRGYTVHAFVDRDRKPIRPPAWT